MPAAHRPKPPAWLWPVITGAYILAWGAVNLGFLTRFPFVHSDEAWLAGLARNIWQSGSPAVTETFFDLKPRWPHGIKMAFHGLQILAIRLGGYNVFSVRVLSLLAGCAVLALFFVAARRLTGSGLAALGAVAALSLDVQFINAAHMARQEIFILLFMAACLAILCREGPLSTGHILLLAVFTGAAVWFHPNSFLAACLCGGALLVRWAFRQASLKQLALYVALTGALAGAVVAFCFWLDPQFPVHYMMYGQGEFDLLVPVTSKLGQLGGYFSRLWNQFSGTYYLPNIRVQLVLFCLAAVLAGFFALVMHREQPRPAAQALSLLAGAGGAFVRHGADWALQPDQHRIFLFARLAAGAVLLQALWRMGRAARPLCPGRADAGALGVADRPLAECALRRLSGPDRPVRAARQPGAGQSERRVLF